MSATDRRGNATTDILESSGLDLRIELCPFNNLISGHAFRDASDAGKHNNSKENPPLYSIFNPGFPPKTAILVPCCSLIKVANMAHVEAQMPLDTSANIQSDAISPNQSVFTDCDIPIDY